MALVETKRALEADKVPFDLISFLKANAREKIQILAFVNHLPNDDYHFELITNGQNNHFQFTKVKKEDFEYGLNSLEEFISTLEGKDPDEAKGHVIENGEKWKKRQKARLRSLAKKDITLATPQFISVITRLSEMKTKLWQAHDSTIPSY